MTWERECEITRLVIGYFARQSGKENFGDLVNLKKTLPQHLTGVSIDIGISKQELLEYWFQNRYIPSVYECRNKCEGGTFYRPGTARLHEVLDKTGERLGYSNFRFSPERHVYCSQCEGRAEWVKKPVPNIVLVA